jgi:hypothetical protein
MKTTLIWIALLGAALLWIADLRRRLHAAQLRGDMYYDISARLDRRLADLIQS